MNNSVSEVVIDFFGLAAFQAVAPRTTSVLLLSGGKEAHLPCLAVPVAGLDRQEDFSGQALPRAVDGSGADLRLFSLRDYKLTLQAGEGRDHQLGKLVSLREMFKLSDGTDAKYRINAQSDRIVCDVTLSGGRIETRADPPFGATPVRYATNDPDPLPIPDTKGFVDTVVTWQGIVPSVLHLNSRNGAVDPWKLHLKPAAGKEAIRLSIYCLPSSIEPVDNDLLDFLTLYKLLEPPPKNRYYPTLKSATGALYDDFPKCIPPALI